MQSTNPVAVDDGPANPSGPTALELRRDVADALFSAMSSSRDHCETALDRARERIASLERMRLQIEQDLVRETAEAERWKARIAEEADAYSVASARCSELWAKSEKAGLGGWEEKPFEPLAQSIARIDSQLAEVSR